MFPAARTFTLVLILSLTIAIHHRATEAHASDAGDEPCPVHYSDGHLSCPINCFRPDPVCGENGKTYWCGCPEAACAGVRVVKSGYCEVGNSGSGLVSGQAFLLIHIVWLIILGFSVLCGFF